MSVPLVVTNMMLTEIVVNVPGVFPLLQEGDRGADAARSGPPTAALQVFAIHAAIFIVVGTIIADRIAARLDPRIKRAERLPA